MCEYISMHVCVAIFVWTVMLFLIRLIKLVKHYGKQNKHIKVEKNRKEKYTGKCVWICIDIFVSMY